MKALPRRRVAAGGVYRFPEQSEIAMRTERVVCDYCERDLTSVGMVEEYRLSLTIEQIPPMRRGGILGGPTPPITREHHFCTIKCLAGWVDRFTAAR
jgi:hypothetical protein